ncbi:MAG: MFS transporter [Chloroflexi bacterium]|nr:MAG: MFS transporter [Chloroflexota bacterium]
MIKKDRQFYRFALYGFLKNLRFFEPFIILIFRENGLTFFQIGILYSIRDLTNNLTELPTGFIADAFGRRKSMVFAFIAYILSFFVFYTFSNFYISAVAMVLFGLGESFRSGTHKALILEHLKLNDMLDLKVAYYGRTRAASQMGSAFNSLIAAALLFFTGDYRTMFLAATIPYMIDLINLATYPKILDGELTQFDRNALWGQVKATLKDFIGIFRDQHTMRAILNSASFTALFKSTKDYLQPILEAFALALPFLIFVDDVKRSGVVVGIVYFFIYLLTSYASRSSNEFSRRFKNLTAPINLTFLAGVGFLFVAGLSTWQNLTLISILLFLGFYVLQNLRKPMNVAFISDQISHKVMASGLSVEAQFTTILVAVLAPILGVLADTFGVGIALTVLGAGTFLLYSFVKVK